MRFALTQMDIVWENPVENRRLCTELTEQAAAQGCDWIVFPEMTLTGFTMHPELFAAIYHCNKGFALKASAAPLPIFSAASHAVCPSASFTDISLPMLTAIRTGWFMSGTA